MIHLLFRLSFRTEQWNTPFPSFTEVVNLQNNTTTKWLEFKFVHFKENSMCQPQFKGLWEWKQDLKGNNDADDDSDSLNRIFTRILNSAVLEFPPLEALRLLYRPGGHCPHLPHFYTSRPPHSWPPGTWIMWQTSKGAGIWMDRNAEGLLCFQHHWGRDLAEGHVVYVLFSSSYVFHWWSSTGRISNNHLIKYPSPFHVVLICISAASISSGTPKKWQASPQSLGDEKSNLAKDNPTYAPYPKTLQQQSSDRGEPSVG